MAHLFFGSAIFTQLYGLNYRVEERFNQLVKDICQEKRL
jgi:hypothetical protein